LKELASPPTHTCANTLRISRVRRLTSGIGGTEYAAADFAKSFA
jgi:hypothetical protein